jgi:arylsulfatase A-like enzyme
MMVAFVLSGLVLMTGLAAAATGPNVLVIVADDLGYADVGFQGSKVVPTPHLDRIAAAGVRCTSGYVSHAFCSPTRAGMLTGRYQHRFGHENNPVYNVEDARSGLPTSEVTLADVMKKAGYTTGLVGKWHLGAHPSFHPNQRGFDEFFGFLGGGHTYLQDANIGGPEYRVPLQFNGQERPFDGYLTDMLGSEAAAFALRHEGKPWFLYLAFNAPHTPLSVPEERLAPFSGMKDRNRQIYAAMIAALDAAVGVTMAALEKSAQLENTLVFFFSDNGGPHLSGRGLTDFADNLPLRGAKGQVYEGGVRVPFLISWPAKLKSGLYAEQVSALDVFATAAAVAGAALPADRKMDSVNLVPHLTGEKAGPPHESLVWRTNGKGGNYALREGQWKLVRQGDAAPELYDLNADVGEASDIASAHPDKVKSLLGKLNAWEAEMIEPAFQGPVQNQRKKAKAK